MKLVLLIAIISVVIWYLFYKEVSNYSQENGKWRMISLLFSGTLSTLVIMVQLVQRL